MIHPRTQAYFEMLAQGNTRAVGNPSPKQSIYTWFNGPIKFFSLLMPSKDDQLYYWFARAVHTCPETARTPAAKHAYFEELLLEHITLSVNDMELLVGLRGEFSPNEAQQEEIQWAKEHWDELTDGGNWGNNATGHRVVDWEKLLRVGLQGIVDEIDSRLADLSEKDEKQDFYLASRRSVVAVIRLAERYRRQVLAAAEKAEPVRKAELLAIADLLARVPRYPAQSFYEALESVWLVQFALCVVGDASVSGRFDQYMYPFYRKDVAAGKITRDSALELIEQYYFKNDELFGVFPAAILLCGQDKEGNTVCNDISYLCVEAIRTTKLINPSVGIAWRKELPEDFLELCLKPIAEGYTRPSFFHDDLIQKGLRDAGYTAEDARCYCHSTCVEITPVACSNVTVTTPYIDLNKSMEYVLGEGKALFGKACCMEHNITRSLDSLATFDDFLNYLCCCVKENLRTELRPVIDTLERRYVHNASPLASALLNDCLARGKDCGSGGARYSMNYPCFPGFINFVDAITAIRHAVYEDKKYTLREIAEACKNNFPEERMRLYLLNQCPKFGNDIAEVDALAEKLFTMLADELQNYRTAEGTVFYPSFFAWIMHGVLGIKASASPDGRRQGEALSEHLGAAQGRDKKGPLAVIRSISHLPQSRGLGGIASNFRFSSSFASSQEGQKAILALIAYFMENNGFEMQFNVVSSEQLREAQAHPENYRTLLVRVAGYNDYFVNLDPVIQEEILRRKEHDGI